MSDPLDIVSTEGTRSSNAITSGGPEPCLLSQPLPWPPCKSSIVRSSSTASPSGDSKTVAGPIMRPRRSSSGVGARTGGQLLPKSRFVLGIRVRVNVQTQRELRDSKGGFIQRGLFFFFGLGCGGGLTRTSTRGGWISSALGGDTSLRYCIAGAMSLTSCARLMYCLTSYFHLPGSAPKRPTTGCEKDESRSSSGSSISSPQSSSSKSCESSSANSQSEYICATSVAVPKMASLRARCSRDHFGMFFSAPAFSGRPSSPTHDCPVRTVARLPSLASQRARSSAQEVC